MLNLSFETHKESEKNTKGEDYRWHTVMGETKNEEKIDYEENQERKDRVGTEIWRPWVRIDLLDQHRNESPWQI